MFSFHFHDICYSASHKQTSCFRVLEILFEKRNFSFRIPQKVWLIYDITYCKGVDPIQMGSADEEKPWKILSLRCRGCSAAILHYLHSTDLPLGYIALTLGSWRHWGLKSITPKSFCSNSETVVGELHRRASMTRNFRGWQCCPRRLVLKHTLKGKAESIQSFYTLAPNISRNLHTLKCKSDFLGPSDNSNLGSFRITDHWLGDFVPTYSMTTDEVTNLFMENITQDSTQPFHHHHLPSQWRLCDAVVSVSSLALSHSCIQIPSGGYQGHLLCPKPQFLPMCCLGGLRGDEAMVVCS